MSVKLWAVFVLSAAFAVVGFDIFSPSPTELMVRFVLWYITWPGYVVAPFCFVGLFGLAALIVLRKQVWGYMRIKLAFLATPTLYASDLVPPDDML